MADYIYLLENRLSPAQKNALTSVRHLAREKGLTIFLVGGAVRDLTSGSPVRDLDVVLQGNVSKLKKELEKAGATIAGEHAPGHTLFLTFPGGVRMELGSTIRVNYPKPGKPVAESGTILDDLRRRDFTANAMALSLNEGSYGLLMDPLNGVADIENRELRLVSNYGFIEDPIRMVRAIRLMARLGWQMDEKTQSRYDTGKEDTYIAAASDFQRGYEAEEIVHEEDPLRVLRKLESEGWMTHLAPTWTTAKVNTVELEKMRESQTQLQMQGVHPDPSAGNFPLLTAKMSSQEIADLKKRFPRQGFVAEIDALDAEAKSFASQLISKVATSPSQAWNLIHASKPESVLAAAYASKNPTIQAKFKSFYQDWPKAKQRIPYALMQEMRITPELPGYLDLVNSIMLALMDGELDTVDQLKAFLEPYSPPAPPPPIHLRRPRAGKKEAKSAKGRTKKTAPVDLDDSEELEPTDSRQDIDESDEEDLDDQPGPTLDSEEEEDEDDQDNTEPPVAIKPATPLAAKKVPPVSAAHSPKVVDKTAEKAKSASAIDKVQLPAKAKVTASPSSPNSNVTKSTSAGRLATKAVGIAPTKHAAKAAATPLKKASKTAIPDSKKTEPAKKAPSKQNPVPSKPARKAIPAKGAASLVSKRENALKSGKSTATKKR